MKTTLALILILIGIGIELFAQEKIYVMPAHDKTKSVSQPTMQYVRDQLSISFANSKQYQAVDMPSIDALIDLKAFYEQGYISDKAKIELGKIPDCQYILKTELSTDKSNIAITVKLLYKDSLIMVPGKNATQYVSDNKDAIIAACNKIIENLFGGDNNAEFYYKQGNYYYEKNEYEKAQLSYSMAIELKPDYAEAYYKRALLWEREGVIKNKDGFDFSESKAFMDFSKAIALNPIFAEAYYERGVWYYNIDSKEILKAAIDDFSKAISLSSYEESLKILEYRARSYELLGEYNGAISDYNDAISDLTNSINIATKYNLEQLSSLYCERACVYKRINQDEKAELDANKAKELNPGIDMDCLLSSCRGW